MNLNNMASEYIRKVREAYSYLKWDIKKLDEEIAKIDERMKKKGITEELIAWKLQLIIIREKKKL